MWYNIYCLVKADEKASDQANGHVVWHQAKDLVYLVFNSIRGVKYDYRKKDIQLRIERLDTPNGKQLLEQAQNEKFGEDNGEIYYESKDFEDLNSADHEFNIVIDTFETAKELNDYVSSKNGSETIWIGCMYVHVGDYQLPSL